MTDNSGALSIDFLVGFTIFILAFIWVATMIPNLFIGLTSHTIDYDAVAYRTGVILAEDPGDVSAAQKAKTNLQWEALSPVDGKADVTRFGLAISKNSPNILSEAKVDRFFNKTIFTYPDDYQKRAIFGDYPYRFNISLKIVGEDKVLSVGDVIPEDHSYGYIRRDVKIKEEGSNTTINATPPATGTHWESIYHEYSVMIDSNELRYGMVRDPSYQIIPQTDRITINITNLTGSMNYSAKGVSATSGIPPAINLSKIDFYQRLNGEQALSKLPPNTVQNYSIYIDGKTTASEIPTTPPWLMLIHEMNVPSNVSLIFESGAFSKALNDKKSTVFINMTFGIDPAQEYLNSSYSVNPMFNYTYIQKNPKKGFVTPPSLREGVLEVAVW